MLERKLQIWRKIYKQVNKNFVAIYIFVTQSVKTSLNPYENGYEGLFYMH